jgi:uncharacterized protein YbjT (DUF2867 family)
MKTAIVLGATGLTGSRLVDMLLGDKRFGAVKIFVRRSTGIINGKLEEHVVNFDKPDEWQQWVIGDVLFSAMGTTIKVAGSKDAQYKIDYTYQYQMAQIAAANGVGMYVLISAGGADAGSSIFYSRMKGELERDVKQLSFHTVHILRPGILWGNRKEVRTGERIGIAIMRVLGAIPGLKAYRPIDVSIVAAAMINAAHSPDSGVHVYGMGAVFKLGGE